MSGGRLTMAAGADDGRLEALGRWVRLPPPGTAAAIIGGISLSGGRGRPMGTLTGVLVLCVLRSGLNALGASPHVHEIATGAVLLTVAILDGPALVRRLTEWRLRLKGERAGATP